MRPSVASLRTPNIFPRPSSPLSDDNMPSPSFNASLSDFESNHKFLRSLVTPLFVNPLPLHFSASFLASFDLRNPSAEAVCDASGGFACVKSGSLDSPNFIWPICANNQPTICITYLDMHGTI